MVSTSDSMMAIALLMCFGLLDDLIMQDDSYIRIDDGLYLDLEYSGTLTENIAMNVFY